MGRAADVYRLWESVSCCEPEIGAVFDRFGFFNQLESGHYLEVWLEDLSYTARKPWLKGPG